MPWTDQYCDRETSTQTAWVVINFLQSDWLSVADKNDKAIADDMHQPKLTDQLQKYEHVLSVMNANFLFAGSQFEIYRFFKNATQFKMIICTRFYKTLGLNIIKMSIIQNKINTTAGAQNKLMFNFYSDRHVDFWALNINMRHEQPHQR